MRGASICRANARQASAARSAAAFSPSPKASAASPASARALAAMWACSALPAARGAAPAPGAARGCPLGSVSARASAVRTHWSPSLPEVRRPQKVQHGHQPQGRQCVPVYWVQRPLQRGPQVVLLSFQLVERGNHLSAEQSWLAGFGQLEKEFSMAVCAGSASPAFNSFSRAYCRIVSNRR